MAKQKRRLKRQGRAVKRKSRKCLSCDVKFSAQSKFHRLCPTCKKRFAYYNIEDEQTLRVAYGKAVAKE